MGRRAGVPLSGVGRHLCWLVDENTNLLRIWNISASHTWRRRQPRIEYIPYWSNRANETPLFACEIDDVTGGTSDPMGSGTAPSIAFCSAHGIVTSVDNSARFRVVRGAVDPVVVSSFACGRRYCPVNSEASLPSRRRRAWVASPPPSTDAATVMTESSKEALPRRSDRVGLVTALGTEDGMIIVDIYCHTATAEQSFHEEVTPTRHYTAQLDAVTLLQLAADASAPPPYSSSSSSSSFSCTSRRRDVDSSTTPPSWWSTLSSLVQRARRCGAADRAAQDEKDAEESHRDGLDAADERQRAAEGWDGLPLPSSSPASVTHVLLRRSEGDQLVAATSHAMIYLLSFDLDAEAEEGEGSSSSSTTTTMRRADWMSERNVSEGNGCPVVMRSGAVHHTQEDTYAHPAGALSLRPLWCCSVRRALHLPESASTALRVLALAETRHTVCALVLLSSTSSSGVPALVLLTMDSPTGVVVNARYIPTMMDVVAAAQETLPAHIGLHLMDATHRDSHGVTSDSWSRSEGAGAASRGEERSADAAVVLIRHFCLCVNNALDDGGLGGEPSSLGAKVVETRVMRGLCGPIASVWRSAAAWGSGRTNTNTNDDCVAGVVIALDHRGPHRMRAHRGGRLTAARTHARAGSSWGEWPFLGADGSCDDDDDDAEARARVAELLHRVRVDAAGGPTLDAPLLQLSAELSREHRAQRGNWARADLDTEDGNTVLYVTRQLRRRQQRHRRLVRAVYGSPEVMSLLLPGTLAQLISTQEALLALVSLRGLQNASFGPMAAAPTASAQPSSRTAGMMSSWMAPSDAHGYRRLVTRVPAPSSSVYEEAHDRTHGALGCNGNGYDDDDVQRKEGDRVSRTLTDGEEGEERVVRLVQDDAQLRLCQQMLREAMVRVANELRRRRPLSASATASTTMTTAVELVYASADHILLVLEALLQHVRAVRASATPSMQSKFDAVYAVGCLFVIVAQTVTESRDDLATTARITAAVRARLWTSSEEDYAATRGVARVASMPAAHTLPTNQRQDKSTRPGKPASPFTSTNTNSSNSLTELVEGCTRLPGLVLHMCEEMSHTLADITDLRDGQTRRRPATPSPSEPAGLSAAMEADAASRDMGLRDPTDMLDLMLYLLQFSLRHRPDAHDEGFASTALCRTLLRAPFVHEPHGYPHGPPTAAVTHTSSSSSSSASSLLPSAELHRRMVQSAESLALSFNAVSVLMRFALATVVADPLHPSTEAACGYGRLRWYCAQRPLLYRAALRHLWQTGREWELLCLHAVVGEETVRSARLERDVFLESHAPHLLWLATPSRFDALVREGAGAAAAATALRYGKSALQHRTRCLALARLAWIADGAECSGRSSLLELDEAVVAAQRTFLTTAGRRRGACSETDVAGRADEHGVEAEHRAAPLPGAEEEESVVLGPQALVQRLLRLEGCVAAWVAAAQVVCLTAEPLRADLLVQILQHCRNFDGPSCLRTIERECACELETSRAIAATALGQVILACESMQEIGELSRLCESVLTADEFRLISSWLVACWSGEDGSHGGPDGVRRPRSVVCAADGQ